MESSLRLALRRFVAVLLLAGFGAGVQLVTGSDEALDVTMDKKPPLPKSVPWRIGGMRVVGREPTYDWEVRAAGVYPVGERFGPFRVQAFKKLVVDDLYVQLRSNSVTLATGTAIRDGVERLGTSLGPRTRVSRVSVRHIEVVVLDEEGNLRCRIRAGAAEWRADERDGVSFTQSVSVDAAHATARAPAAVLWKREASIVAAHWTRTPLAAPGLPPLSRESCPVRVFAGKPQDEGL